METPALFRVVMYEETPVSGADLYYRNGALLYSVASLYYGDEDDGLDARPGEYIPASLADLNRFLLAYPQIADAVPQRRFEDAVYKHLRWLKAKAEGRG